MTSGVSETGPTPNNATTPKSIGVVGGGTMGVGIAYVYAAAGWTTTVVEPDASRASTLKQTLAQAAQSAVKRGKMGAQQAAQLPQAVHCVAEIDELPKSLDLVVETVPERLDIKRKVLAAIETRQPAIIASNTSALSIDTLAAPLRDPASFLGMHFFNPVWSLPMVELIRGASTSEETLSRARAYAESTGKTTITVRDVPGFATSRLDLIASLEAMRMLQDKVASAEDIDRAMVIAYRHPMGPLRLSDIVGLDVRLDIARNLCIELGERYAPPQILIDMVARGELGKKTGRGFFDWPDTAT